jgi:SAM-dependent methyltransferase
MNKTTGTSSEVLEYYSKNWDKIANCYKLDEEGYPVDPAWYRRRLYQQFLKENKPTSVLDIGCGGGWTVLDALQLGIKARGIEPVKELKEFGCDLMEKNGFDRSCIQQDDLSVLASLPDASEDCIALLSVIPHVPSENWNKVHNDIVRVLKPGGKLIVAYRNELFDFFTFNSITLEFYDRTLWDKKEFTSLNNTETIDLLKGLITHPDLPGKYFTAAEDQSFGKLERKKSNPLTIKDFLLNYGLLWESSQFYNFHCVPPLMQEKVKNLKKINYDAGLNLVNDWRGYFMCPMFLVTASKI